MRKYIIAIVMVALLPVASHALDKKLGTTNSFKVGIFDTSSRANGGAGLDVVAPYSDFDIKIQCGSNTIVTMDESGDTIVDEGGGYYYVTTNDAITHNAEEECLAWVEGEGVYSGLIMKAPVRFKAVAATMSHVGLLKEIVVSSSTTSTITSAGFSEGSNKGYVGGIINCPNATAVDNRPIFLKIISFNPATDTVTLNGLLASNLTASDVCDVYIDTVR